ncbi:MAG: hypothetical protein JWL83_2133 [Actinomycetia bacterium]|nr:hypothetical protein [Actinomycetes bacterium]
MALSSKSRVAVTTDALPGATSASRRFDRPTVVRLSVIFVVMAVVVGATWATFAGVRGDIERTGTRLAATSAQLHTTSRQLHAASQAREAATARLGTAKNNLDAARTGRDIAFGHLQATQRELNLQQSHLTAASKDLTNRFLRLANLNQCLGGASKALNQAAVSDLNGLARTLASIQASCNAARGTA